MCSFFGESIFSVRTSTDSAGQYGLRGDSTDLVGVVRTWVGQDRLSWGSLDLDWVVRILWGSEDLVACPLKGGKSNIPSMWAGETFVLM